VHPSKKQIVHSYTVYYHAFIFIYFCWFMFMDGLGALGLRNLIIIKEKKISLLFLSFSE